MTFEFAHNFLRKLMNVEWDELPFLNDKQKDGFFANPHTFFIRADDDTARKIWDVLYPKPPLARDGVVIDWDEARRRVDRGLVPAEYRYKWSPEVRVGGVPVIQNGAADTFPPLVFATAH
ncbi:hypothetical protein [Bosea sp. LjRoot237]|uniref:hypothetical protein n=1 Tax=Bosea sp. LjRoot237 TaxID=3342292 RepID=UPI003ECFA75A